MAVSDDSNPAGADPVALQRVNDALNYDFCPWANRWVYWMKHPLVGMTAVALTAGLCGMYVAPQAWLLFLGLMLVVVLGLAWPAITVYGLRAHVHFDQAWCEEGQTTRIRVSIRNRLPLPAWGLSLSGGVPGEELLVSFSRVNGWRTTDFVWSFTPRQRGVYPEGPIFIESGFPFGVWTARQEVISDGQLVVFPRPVELDAVPDIGQAGFADELYSDRQTGEAGDVAGTRAFRQGDSLRRVHWALSARMSRLICCERQAVLHSSAWVSLDTLATHHGPPGADSSLEWSIRIFAGVCKELINRGIAVQADWGYERLQVQPGQHGLRRLLLKLAQIPRNGTAGQPRSRSKLPLGSMRIAVLTDRSQGAAGDLQIVLLAQQFGESPTGAPASARDAYLQQAGDLGGRRIVIAGPQDLATQLKRDWRRVCHAVS